MLALLVTPAFPLLVTQFYLLLIHSLFGEGRLVTNCFFCKTFELPGCWNMLEQYFAATTPTLLTF